MNEWLLPQPGGFEISPFRYCGRHRWMDFTTCTLRGLT